MTHTLHPNNSKLLTRFTTAQQLCKITHNYNNFVQGICVWIGDTICNNNDKHCQFWLKDINMNIIRCTLTNTGHKYFPLLQKGNCYQVSNYMLSIKCNLIIDKYTQLNKIKALIKIRKNGIFIVPHKRIPYNNYSTNKNNKDPSFIPASANPSSLITSYFVHSKHQKQQNTTSSGSGSLYSSVPTYENKLPVNNTISSKSITPTTETNKKQIQTSILNYTRINK